MGEQRLQSSNNIKITQPLLKRGYVCEQKSRGCEPLLISYLLAGFFFGIGSENLNLIILSILDFNWSFKWGLNATILFS
jgi:hypothetical protein